MLITGTSVVSAQGNSGKGKGKKMHKSESVYKEDREDDDHDNGKEKIKNHGNKSSHQPAKVMAAFQRDYPNARNVTWGKYRGDWTATFGNGLFRSTAVYHANGERRDTRTGITRNNLPGDVSIWDQIFRRNQIQQNNIVQIEQPQSGNLIYRLINAAGNAYFYNQLGQQVNYNY